MSDKTNTTEGGDEVVVAATDDGRTLVPGGPPASVAPETDKGGPTLASLPDDRTLDATDPASQAYREAALAAAKNTAATATSFGDYDLLEPIAKGGMGIVYKARQRKLNRIVAIKMILAGQFADQQDIDRFYAEAEAAAALSHPNIVAIHEIGETGGQHFFSMDFIDGQSLADLVRENPLRPRRAAEFVKIIAETIQFAHDNGVIHRDLKPANILLDKRQRPLVTDFGLAKQVSSQSQRTMAGSIVGTPSYMSPEQAAGRTDEIGHLSDLYSLGAILYELLTGRPPFRAASPFETVRQVLEIEPLSPRLLNENVPRDLETICLKCLQKERARRYASSQELADELARFLSGEPIHARPISRPERLWRLMRRNPVTSFAIATAAAFFICASIISTVAYIKTSAALALAEQRLTDSMTAIDDLYTRVSEDKLLNQPGMQSLRKDLLAKAKEYYEKFLTEAADDPRVQDGVARSHYRLGRIAFLLGSPDEALEPFNRAREIQQRLVSQRPEDPHRQSALGDTLNALGEMWVRQNELEKAHLDYQEAAKVRTALASKHPASAEYQRLLANTLMNAGVAEFLAANKDKARELFVQAQQVRQQALQVDPQDIKLRQDLAKGYYSLARIDGSLERFTDSETSFNHAINLLQKLCDEQPDDLEQQKLLAISYRLLADLLGDPRFPDKDRLSDRRQLYETALKRLDPLANKNPDVVDYQTERAAVFINLSDVEAQAANSPAARAAIERAKDVYATLVAKFPGVPRHQRDLAVTLRELAREQSAAGDQHAADNLAKALGLLTELVKQYPEDADYAEQLEATKQVSLNMPPQTQN